MSRPVALRTLPYAGVALLTALALGGCGGGSATTSSAAPTGGSTPAPTGTAGRSNGQGQRQPGVQGLIAAVSGSTMQVQTRTDQTAVTWSDATTFSKEVAASLADVTTGSCVTVLEPPSTSTATPGATPTEVTAAAVQVRPASNGTCAGAFAVGGAGGSGGAGATGGPGGTATRTGAPTRSGADGAAGGGGFGRRAVNGLVTKVSGDTITVRESARGGNGGSAGSGTAGGNGSSGTIQTVTVTTTGATTYLAEKPAAASDVAVGECATAMGKADDTGAVAATMISLRPATTGSCTGAGGGGRSTGTATTGSTNG